MSSSIEFFAQVCLATAKMANAYVEVILADDAITSTKEYKLKNITGALPMLENDEGATITDALAICKYLAKVGPNG